MLNRSLYLYSTWALHSGVECCGIRADAAIFENGPNVATLVALTLGQALLPAAGIQRYAASQRGDFI